MHKRLLIGILFLATVLRFWNLGTYPDAIDEDEMALGYYAYSLVTSGTDEYGNPFPIYFESAGDYKYGLYSYFAVIPVGLFGLNPVTTRSVAAAAGVLSVAVVYFLSREIFNNKKLALITAAVLAIAPTHIHFSRVAYSNILGAFFAMLSVLFLLRYYKKLKLKYLAVSILFFLLGIYAYQAYRIFLPTVFVLISLLFIKKPFKKSVLQAMFISGLAIAIVIISFVPAKSRARSQSVSLLSEQPKLVEYFSEDGISKTPLILTRLVHNKYQSLGFGIAKRYVEYFDPVFLFFESSPTVQRHTTPETGLLYLIEAPLLLIGFMTITRSTKDKKKFVPFILLLASPVAASFVLDTVSTTRAVILTYAFSFFTAYGVYLLISRRRIGKWLLLIVFSLYLANFVYYAHQYLVHKTYHHPWYSDVGLKEMVVKVDTLYNGYDAVVISHGHYIPFLFYNQISPKDFISESNYAPKSLDNGVKVINFNKIYFNMPYECPLAGKENVLYVCFGSQLPANASLVDVIRYKDDQPAIMLVEFSGEEEKAVLPDKVHYSSNVDENFANGLLPQNYPSYWPLPK